jgi:GNAT superfamily N-acetyltransferase
MSSDDLRLVPMVRDALSGDAAAVRAVAAAGWRDTYTGLFAAATIESFVASAYSVERLERRIAGHTFLVVEDGHGIVAFADAIPEPDRLNLVAIYALPEWRGRGAGTALLDTLRERFPDLPIAADVLAGNRKGETFYEHRGFEPRERLEEDLFGEAVLERRWWLGEPPPAGT